MPSDTHSARQILTLEDEADKSLEINGEVVVCTARHNNDEHVLEWSAKYRAFII